MKKTVKAVICTIVAMLAVMVMTPGNAIAASYFTVDCLRSEQDTQARDCALVIAMTNPKSEIPVCYNVLNTTYHFDISSGCISKGDTAVVYVEPHDTQSKISIQNYTQCDPGEVTPQLFATSEDRC